MSTNNNEINENININLDFIIHLDHHTCEEEDCPCHNDNAVKVDCEEEDCENCHRGKYCDCDSRDCPYCNKDYYCNKDEDSEDEDEKDSEICCAGCNMKKNADVWLEEDIEGEMWCPECYAMLKDKFKKSYRCDEGGHDSEDEDSENEDSEDE